jgi:hypothetical protein
MPGTGSVHTALDLEGTLEVSERLPQRASTATNGERMLMTEWWVRRILATVANDVAGPQGLYTYRQGGHFTA